MELHFIFYCKVHSKCDRGHAILCEMFSMAFFIRIILKFSKIEFLKAVKMGREGETVFFFPPTIRICIIVIINSLKRWAIKKARFLD